MKKLILILFSLTLVSAQAQFSIKSGEEEISKNRQVASPKNAKVTNLGETMVSSNLRTSTSSIKSNAALFDLYVLREETKVTLNLTLEKGDLPEFIVVQRKTSKDISEYTTFKEFTPEEIEILREDSKIIFEDNYPESRKLDSYYRIIYEYASGAKKITSGVLLAGQVGNTEGIYGDHVKDESLFVNERKEKQDQGVSVIAERIDGKVNLIVQNSGVLEAGQQVTIERKTNDNLSTFRSVKLLDDDELNMLMSSGQIIVNDKYPPSYKSKAKYRVVVSSNNEIVYEFPEVALVNIN